MRNEELSANEETGGLKEEIERGGQMCYDHIATYCPIPGLHSRTLFAAVSVSRSFPVELHSPLKGLDIVVEPLSEDQGASIARSDSS